MIKLDERDSDPKRDIADAITAATVGDLPTLRRLLERRPRGADIHATHGAGLGSSGGYAPENLQPIDTPLAWAERRGHLEIASTLRRHGATG